MAGPHVVPDFSALRVAVVGDLIADHYLYVRPTRVSREAPVLVMRHTGERIGAGGAANLARNVAALGARTLVSGVVARDASGRELLRLLDAERIDVKGIAVEDDWVTPTKMRVLGAESGRTHQQMLRVDREPERALSERACSSLAQHVHSLAGRVDALLLSDYGYGAVGEEVLRAARQVQDAGAVIVLDPRVRFDFAHGLTAVTPNLSELAEATGRSVEELADFRAVVHAAQAFRERWASRWLLVTMGNRGMALFSEDAPQGVRVAAAGAESVVDVSGAGDTCAATFALGLAADLDGPQAMRLANAAASVVVMENGAAVCPRERLQGALAAAPHPLGSTTSLSG